MHKLYNITLTPHICDSTGNALYENAPTLVCWRGFYSNRALNSMKRLFEEQRTRDEHSFSSLMCDEVSPRDVAVKIAQYILSKGEYKTSNDDLRQEHIEALYDLEENPRKFVREFLEERCYIPDSPSPLDVKESWAYHPDCEIDSDFVNEVLGAFQSLIYNCYEPYREIATYFDESEEEIQSWKTVYLEDGMLVTRDYMKNTTSEMCEGADGDDHPQVYLTFNNFLSEYADFIWEADLDSFVSEYKDEIAWRKSLGFKIEEPSRFLKRWFSNYTVMELCDFPEEWQDAINDAHAIAAA